MLSGLVSEFSEKPERYQLVHDYLVEPIRRSYDYIPKQLEAAKKKQQQAEEERKQADKARIRILKRSLSGLTIGIVLLLGLSVTAIRFALQSRRQAKIQYARQLAATSEWIRSQRANLHEPSVLLALESYKLSHDINEPSSETDSALRNGLNLLPNHIAVISHQDEVWQIEFSPNGDYLATGSKDGTAKLVQLSTGKEIAVISHQDEVREIEFSPNGDYLATGSLNNVRLDLLDAKELVKKTCESLSQNLSIDLWQRYIGNQPYRKICQDLPIHPSFLKKGKTLAKEGKISEALSIYKRAKELEPGIDLNPDTKEVVDTDPKLVVNKFFAPTKLEQGEKLAKEGKILEAISTYKKVQKLDPELKIKGNSWNTLCWNGSIYRYAQKVLFACEQAVELAPDNAGYRDSRGLARGLTGNTQGAIDDFQYYVDNSDRPEKYKAQRREWIKALEKGENPFTDEVLEDLKAQ